MITKQRHVEYLICTVGNSTAANLTQHLEQVSPVGETVAPPATRSGRIRKEHDAYEKPGPCASLAMIEPLTGRRSAQVHPQRTKKEVRLLAGRIAALHPRAVKIRMVQDNLNTHDAGAFYENLPADEASASVLAERFEFYDPPKSASRLNRMEMKFSALSRRCLSRRMPSMEKLEREVLVLVTKRTEKNQD